MSLLVVGSVAYDAIETPYASIEKALGGTAIYFSAAASFFAPVKLVAVVGKDFDYKEIDFLRSRKVDFSGLQAETGETFRWKGRYLNNMNDRETIYTHLNVFENFNPVLPENYKDCKYIFLGNIGPDLQYNVIQQVKKPKFVAMDTMNYWISGTLPQLKKTIALVDALIINDSEAKQLAKVDNLFTAARMIQAMGPKILVIKKGEHGSVLVYKKDYFFCPAYPVEKLYDPTGAGDTFAGGFVGYLAKSGKIDEIHLRQAIVYATCFASFCVEDFSVGRLMHITRTDVQSRVRKLVHWMKIDENIIKV
jgi:sugar/nucleoside kinase (ribokinase family)